MNVYLQHWLVGHLFPHSCAPKVQEVSTDVLQGPNIPIQGPSLLPQFCPLDFLHGCQGICLTYLQPEHSLTSLPGWLAEGAMTSPPLRTGSRSFSMAVCHPSVLPPCYQVAVSHQAPPGPLSPGSTKLPTCPTATVEYLRPLEPTRGCWCPSLPSLIVWMRPDFG